MAEEEPGMPMRTAEMKAPETPPIQMARSRMKEVSEERPKVTGRRRAIPKVAERPGIAPKTMPRLTMAKISRRLIGLRQMSKAARYASICFSFLYSKRTPVGRLTWNPKTNIAYKPAVTRIAMMAAVRGLTSVSPLRS